jgi:hypothetical protein
MEVEKKTNKIFKKLQIPTKTGRKKASRFRCYFKKGQILKVNKMKTLDVSINEIDDYNYKYDVCALK